MVGSAFATMNLIDGHQAFAASETPVTSELSSFSETVANQNSTTLTKSSTSTSNTSTSIESSESETTNTSSQSENTTNTESSNSEMLNLHIQKVRPQLLKVINLKKSVDRSQLILAICFNRSTIRKYF